MVSVVYLEFGQDTGHLEADLGDDARLDRTEAEDLDRHIVLDFKDLDTDGTEEKRPGSTDHACDGGENNKG